MLLPFNSIGRCYGQWIVADDMPLKLMLLPIVYWFNILADVIAIIVADVITTFYLFCFWVMLLPIFFCGRCYCPWGWCYCLQWFFFFGWCHCQFCMWQMLLPLRLMLLPIKWYFGWCYCQLVADVITTILNVLADGIAKWQMELPLYGGGW